MSVLKPVLIYYKKFVGQNSKFPNVCLQQQQDKILENVPFKNFGLLKLVLA